MLKITRFDEPRQCRLIIEGKLIAPWTNELKAAYERARTELQGRKLVVHVQCLTVIGPEGEDLLLGLMNDGVRVSGSGPFTKRILRQLARTSRNISQEEPR